MYPPTALFYIIYYMDVAHSYILYISFMEYF